MSADRWPTPATRPPHFDGKALSKLEYAKYLAAALAYLFIKQGDAAGLVTFDRKPLEFLRAASRPSQVRRILEVLDRAKPGADTDAAAVLHDVAERIPKRGVVFLISDLFDDPERIVEALHHFDFRQHELVDLPRDGRGGTGFPVFRLPTIPRSRKDLAHPADRSRRRCAPPIWNASASSSRRIEAACGNLRADYVPVNTKNPLRQTLLRYIGRRMHAKRGR